MEYKDKLRFCHIIDIKASISIAKFGTEFHPKYKARIQLNLKKEAREYFINYLDTYLPMIKYSIIRKNDLTISNNSNLSLLITYIKNEIIFQKYKLNILYDFIQHRTTRNKKKYDLVDEEYYKLIHE